MGKKILIVDDSATIRQQAALALSEAGFEVVQAVDGRDGVSKIQSIDDLALVICDVNMPTMNGIELVETVHADPNIRAVPIVMLTTEGDPSLVARAKQAGAKGWIVKPFRAELLIAAARKLAA